MKKQIVITIVIIVAVLAGLAVGGYFMVNKSVKSAKAELNKNSRTNIKNFRMKW